MDFSKVSHFMDRIDSNQIPFREVIVKKDHKTLYSYQVVDGAYEQEKEKSLYYLFSATKIMTCAAATRLIREGKLKLDDPVSKYLPAFASLTVCEGGQTHRAYTALTVKHLFTMTGGFSYNLGDPVIRQYKADHPTDGTTLGLVNALSGMKLLFEPGTKFNYSLCHDVLAGVIEAVTGKTFGQYLSEIFWQPLHMEQTGFEPTPARMEKMHQQFRINFVSRYAVPQEASCAYRLFDGYESGGAGLISCASEYSTFLDALACGEAADGYVPLDKEGIDLMRQDHLGNALRFGAFSDNPLRKGFSYGLGVRTMCQPEMAPSKSPVGAFGWDGAAGAYAVIDPINHLSIFYGMHVLGCPYVYNHVHFALRDLVYDALEQ